MAEETKEALSAEETKQSVEEKFQQYVSDMISYKHLYDENRSNDYYLFLYLASIMNFIERYNEGCLTVLGMKSLTLDISYIINDLNEKKDVDQRDLVRLCLNVLASYATCVLVTGMFEFSKETSAFFELNPFPLFIRNDFYFLQNKALEMIPKLKQILDVYTVKLDSKHRKVFNEEKIKGFVKHIFNDVAIRIGSAGIPDSVRYAKQMN
jgi:hypothetical protein